MNYLIFIINIYITNIFYFILNSINLLLVLIVLLDLY